MSQAPFEVGPYSATRLLATGAQAQVWLADGPEGEVALKLARTDAHRAALKREIDVLSKGEHPGLVRLLDHDPDGGWIAMERVKGALADRWCNTRSTAAIIDMAGELLPIIEHLHSVGVVHGDIKPGNVLVDNLGRPKLLDLGIATLPDDKVAEFKGTLGFAAPELLRGERPSTASDVYGFGALLYRCLSGKAPFQAPDPAALTYLPLVTLPPPPSTHNPSIPKAVDRLILELLARNPRRRPTKLAAVRERLLKASDGRPGVPVLGMLEERDTLRQAVVGAADGEPRCVVVYGPPGCGRKTLITEAVEAARREGIAYFKGPEAVRKALERMRARAGAVVVLRTASKSAHQLARVMADERLPGLLLLHGGRPLTTIEPTPIHLTPPPLGRVHAGQLAEVLGAPSAGVGALWDQSRGLPASLMALVRASAAGRAPEPQDLPRAARDLLARVQKVGEVRVDELAKSCDMDEHTLLDHCETLFACGLLRAARGGLALAAVGA